MEERRRQREVQRKFEIVPRDKFGILLDAARDPRARMLIALGLYIFPRGSEALALKISDISLGDPPIIDLTVMKSGIRDRMRIPHGLERELRTYLTWYGEQVDLTAPGARDFWLLPSMEPPRCGYDRELRGFVPPTEPGKLSPRRHLYKPYVVVQRALTQVGFGTDREGMHTLRRSGARALYHWLVTEQGHDGAVRVVQAMLHHKSSSTTEHYLGLDIDRARRDQVLAGAYFFGEEEPSNVVPIRGASWNAAM